MLSSLNSNEKVAFFLGIGELTLKNMTENEYLIKVREALDLCWDWYETKKPTGDEIYSYLDDGTEFGGLFIYMQMDQEKANEKIWDVLVDAITYINREAYEFNNEKHVPSPIENVDDDLVDHFIDSANMVSSDYGLQMKRLVHFLAGKDISERSCILRFLGL